MADLVVQNDGTCIRSMARLADGGGGELGLDMFRKKDRSGTTHGLYEGQIMHDTFDKSIVTS